MGAVGVDLVHVPSFAEQLAQPGSRFSGVFSAGERAEALRRGLDGDRLASYWAARWAAREALVKAWSSAIFGEPPVLDPDDSEVLSEVEVVTDAWGRPRLHLHGRTAAALASYDAQLSLSHDGDTAIAFVVLEQAEVQAQSPASAARR